MGNKRITKIAAKVNGKVVHPHSRKAKQMNKKAIRKNKMEKQGQIANLGHFKKGIDIMWFRDNMNTTEKKLTKEELIDLARRYVERYDAQLEELKANRASNHKIMVLEEKIKLQKEQFKSAHGIEVPDLTRVDIMEKLKEWDGGLKDTHAFHPTHINESGKCLQ
eukprot:m.138149 g.138149  ORF g.138149 m.138149 type:complete len:164 (-) comp13378_c0_seq1:41-532(-)